MRLALVPAAELGEAAFVSTFDVQAHHRRRTQEAERRADMLERELAKAIRLLGLAVTAAGQGDPIILLRVLEEFDAEMQRPRAEPSVDQLAQLLRATDPDRPADIPAIAEKGSGVRRAA